MYLLYQAICFQNYIIYIWINYNSSRYVTSLCISTYILAVFGDVQKPGCDSLDCNTIIPILYGIVRHWLMLYDIADIRMIFSHVLLTHTAFSRCCAMVVRRLTTSFYFNDGFRFSADNCNEVVQTRTPVV